MKINNICIFASIAAMLLSLNGCSIYRNYKRPEGLPIDSLYRADGLAEKHENDSDTLGIASLSWEEMFQDPALQSLIRLGLENNKDMQVAILRTDQAEAQFKAAKLAFLPSLAFGPNASISKSGSNDAAKSYEIPVQASWEIDLFGSLRNAKKESQSALLGQKAYQQAVRINLIASIANGYYALLMTDEQIRISGETLDVWRENVRTMEAKLKVGDVTQNAVSQTKASYHQLEASYNDLLRQQREAENALCTLLGITSRKIDRSTLGEQTIPLDKVSAGMPVSILSHRPDVLQAEMSLASAYYTTNAARSAFYPNLTLSGSAGWVDSFGKAVSNPGAWVLSAAASLAQPIFSRGKLVSNLRVSKDAEQIALVNYKQSILSAGNEVNDALYAVQSNQVTLEAHEKQVDELQKTVKSAEALYNTANATYLELLTARQSLLSAQLSVASDNLARLQSVVKLYNALGGGVE